MAMPASRGALRGYMALCWCNESRVARFWTRGHAFWILDLPAPRISAPGARESA
jgi:hypothetical protein